MNIKLVVFDFDGVFTDGITTIDLNGNVMKSYNCKDGMGISLLKKNNIEVGVISGYKENKSQLNILKHLKIKYIGLGVKKKIDLIKKWCNDLNVDLKTEVAYMGDDLNDMQIIDEVELSGCPKDAIKEVKDKVNFKSGKKGGKGCVREFCDYILNKKENKLGYFDTNQIIEQPNNSECIQEVDSSYKNKILQVNNLNVIILASDPNFRSLTTCYKNCSIIEYQIRNLLITGIKKSNIHIICNKSSNNFIFLEEIGCNIYDGESNKRSGEVLQKTLNKISINEFSDYLIIQGHLFFTIDHLELVFNKLDKNVIFTDFASNTLEKGIHINSDNNIITSYTDNLDNINFPWNIFYGFILLNSKFINKLNIKKDSCLDKNLIDLVFSFSKLNNIKIENVNVSNTLLSDDNNSNIIKLKGGSYASLNKINLVRKTATGKGYSKLEYELKFLENNITNDILDYFPKIINKYKDEKIIYFDMPFYNFECLQRVILTGKISKNEVMEVLGNVYKFIFEKLFTKIISNNVDDWVKKKHIDRVLIRLNETENYSETFKKIINQKYIYINNKKYKNIRELMNRINNSKFLTKMKPDYMRLIHGDLHFENIMIYKINNIWKFKLIDPRGELSGSDLYYDMGKLYHSFNGLYDFIRTDQFICNYNFENNELKVNLHLGDKEMNEIYNYIKSESIKLFNNFKLLNSDPLWEAKSKFTEVMHWSSVFPFHMHNKSRSEALYFKAVILFNEFINDYEYLL
tara:strand:+ start:1697 stop:3928 length:2232 start_codon:yes stop_codon:yes gene_type:complete